MIKNVFNNTKPPKTGERFTQLLKHKNILIKKIVSSNKPNPKIYKQDHDEWVLLLRGNAQLRVKKKIYNLQPGDYIFIKTGQEHEVIKTRYGTVWLAVHLKKETQ